MIGPPSRAAHCDMPSRPLASWSLSGVIVCGIKPTTAGWKNADAAPLIAAATTNGHSSWVWLNTATASISWAPARTRSEPIIT